MQNIGTQDLITLLGVIGLFIGLFLVSTYFRKDLRNPSEQIDSVPDTNFSPNMGIIASKYQAALCTAQEEAARAAASKATAIGTLHKTVMGQKHELEVEPERIAKKWKLEQITTDNVIVRTVAANKDLLTLPDFDSHMRELTQNKAKLQLKAGESKIEFEQYEQKARVDVQKDYDIRINQLKAVLALKTFPYLKLAEIRKNIKKLLKEDAKVADSKLPASAKVEYRMLLQDTIAVYRRTYERGLGCLQGDNGREELGTANSFAELGSGVEDFNETLDDEV